MTDARSRGNIVAANAPRSENPAETRRSPGRSRRRTPAPTRSRPRRRRPPPRSRCRRRRRARASCCSCPRPCRSPTRPTDPTTEFWPDGIASDTPTPGDDQRHDQLPVGHVRLGDQRDPGHADGLQHQAADHERPLADPVGERSGDRRDGHERGRPRQQPQPGLERRRSPSTVCSSCAKKNTPVNSDANVKNIAALPAAKPRERKKRIGSIGSAARSSHATNAATSSAPASQRAEHLRAPPACAVAAHQGEDDAERAAP